MIKYFFLLALFLGTWVLTDAQEAVYTTRKISMDFLQWFGFMGVD